MRRTLSLLLLAFLLLVPHAASAQLNYKDQKSVDAEINRRIMEQLKPYQAQIDRDKKTSQDMKAKLDAMMLQATPEQQAQMGQLKMPDFECKRGGCSGEICQPTLPAFENSFAGTCQYMTFYDCYKTATCMKMKDPTGKTDMCRWQDSSELRNCLLTKGGKVGLAHAGFVQ